MIDPLLIDWRVEAEEEVGIGIGGEPISDTRHSVWQEYGKIADCGYDSRKVACLIAAAPNLLAACEGVLESFRTALEAGIMDMNFSQAELRNIVDNDPRILALEEAIAKAKGK